MLDRIPLPVYRRRVELLERSSTEYSRVRGRRPLPMAPIVDALVRPDLELAGRPKGPGRARARLVRLVYLDPASFVTGRVEERSAPAAREFLPTMAAAVPGVPADLLARRVRWCVFGTLGTLLTGSRPRRRSPDRGRSHYHDPGRGATAGT